MTKLKAKKTIAKKPVKKKLTLKQKKFTTEYIKSGNATSAAKKAGYSKKTAKQIATENLSKPAIQAEIKSAADKLGINIEYVLGTIQDTIERCRQAKPVLNQKGEQVYCEDPNGDVLPAYKFDATSVLKGSELLGKHLSLFTEKLEVTGKDGKDLILPSAERLSIAAKKIALLLSQANSK